MYLVGSCALTSFLTGFAVFSILGNLAHVTGKNVSDVVDSGRSLFRLAMFEFRFVGVTIKFVTSPRNPFGIRSAALFS